MQNFIGRQSPAPKVARDFVAPTGPAGGSSARVRRHTSPDSGASIPTDSTVEDADLASHLWTGHSSRVVKTNGTSLILYRCSRCAREFARESAQAPWKAAHVGVFRIDFLDDAVNRQWLAEPCPGCPPQDQRNA
jgi:hypothetical protein